MQKNRQSDEMIKKRLYELLDRAIDRGIFLYSDFLSPADASLAYTSDNERFITAWGGTENAERVILRFGDPSEIMYEEPFPIHIIKIKPKMNKYADALSHRDFLGALMNLGIERDVLGDIRICDNCAYVFCEEKISGFITESLDRVKHTAVLCEMVDELPADALPKIRSEEINTASMRLDSIIAKVFHISRGDAKALFSAEKVFINGRISYSAGGAPKENDVISVSGHGKLIYYGMLRETKKGRLVVSVGRFT